MISTTSRRVAASLVTLAFGLALAEGVLAATCGADPGPAMCGEEIVEHAHGTSEADAGSTVDCCALVGATPDPGTPVPEGEAPSSCPFTAMASGTCQAVSFPAPTHGNPPPPAQGTSSLDAPSLGPDQLRAAPPFHPPRA